MATSGPSECGKIAQRSRSRSSASSIHETNHESNGKGKRSRKTSRVSPPMRSVTCIDCGEEPASIFETASGFDTWSEKYFHVVDTHMFRRFRCPFSPCEEKFKSLLKMNDHIDAAHPGGKKAAEPPGYHQEVVDKVKKCFPFLNGNEEALKEAPVKKLQVKKARRNLVETQSVGASGSGRIDSPEQYPLDPRGSTDSTDDVINVEASEQLPPASDVANGIRSSSESDAHASTTAAFPVVNIFNPYFLLSTVISPMVFPPYQPIIAPVVQSPTSATASHNRGTYLPSALTISQYESQNPGNEVEDEPFLAFPSTEQVTQPLTVAQKPQENDDDEPFLPFPK